MKVELHPEAEQEFVEAAAAYELRVEGLGQCFVSQLERVVDLLEERPELGVRIDSTFRHLVFRTFRYSLIYGVLREYVSIHRERHPLRPEPIEERILQYIAS